MIWVNKSGSWGTSFQLIEVHDACSLLSSETLHLVVTAWWTVFAQPDVVQSRDGEVS